MDSQIDKITLLTNVCHKLAELLKDPTCGKEMAPEARAALRSEAFENLTSAIDTLSLAAQLNEDYYDIVNIAVKLNVKS